MIEAGKMRRRVSLYAPVKLRSPMGAETVTWDEVATVWAERKALSIRETTRMAGLNEQAEAKFVIRHRTGITTQIEIESAGTRYAVISVEEIGNQEALALIVRAI